LLLLYVKSCASAANFRNVYFSAVDTDDQYTYFFYKINFIRTRGSFLLKIQEQSQPQQKNKVLS